MKVDRESVKDPDPPAWPTGNGANFPVPQLANELQGPGQPLDTALDYLILPGGIGHGSHTEAVLRKQYLAELLKETEG